MMANDSTTLIKKITNPRDFLLLFILSWTQNLTIQYTSKIP